MRTKQDILEDEVFAFRGREWLVEMVVSDDGCELPEQLLDYPEANSEEYEIPWWNLRPGEEDPEDVHVIASDNDGLILYFYHPEFASYIVFAKRVGVSC